VTGSLRIVAASLAAALSVPLCAHAADAAPLLSVRLAPSRMDVAAGKGAVDVQLKIPEVKLNAGDPLLTLPIVIANTATVAETLTGLEARDAQGPIPLTVRDDPPGRGVSWSRHWIAGRPVSGEVVVRYRAPVDDTPPKRGSGPPYSLRTEGGGVSAVGNTFILLPETEKPYRIALSWDLSALPQGSTATSSYGEGDVVLGPGPADRLAETVFMAGPMHREPAKPSDEGFSAAWLGQPPFDPQPLMAWTRRLHDWMAVFFEDHGHTPYRVFLRFNPINAGGGAALYRSFLTTYGKDTAPDSLKGTLSHEMVHTWTQTGLGGQWYGEGIAVHYQGLLPLRAGLSTPDAFLADLNETASRYYSNLLNDTPDEQIAPRFWEDSRIRVLPYDRGAMYFAVVDDRIRKATNGRRSLDDLVREMNRRRKAGAPSDEAAWLELLTGALGESGRQLHADMKAGRLMLPAPDAFGPCFTRTTGHVRRFDLGFDPKSLVGTVKTIRGLKPDSEAAKAGLKDGDVVTYAVAMDAVQGDPRRTLTLQVTRAGRTFPITYLPRGETALIYQWVRKPKVAASACVY